MRARSAPVATIVGGAPPSAASTQRTSAARATGSVAGVPSARSPTIRPPRRTESALRSPSATTIAASPAASGIRLQTAIGASSTRAGGSPAATSGSIDASRSARRAAAARTTVPASVWASGSNAITGSSGAAGSWPRSSSGSVAATRRRLPKGSVRIRCVTSAAGASATTTCGCHAARRSSAARSSDASANGIRSTPASRAEPNVRSARAARSSPSPISIARMRMGFRYGDAAWGATAVVSSSVPPWPSS